VTRLPPVERGGRAGTVEPVTDSTPIDETPAALRARIARLTDELADETDRESRAAIIEQIEILRAELEGEIAERDARDT
jgi:hypothetical protein